MAFNGSGTFNRIYNWTTDAGNGINIEASRMDGEDNGFATGLSNCITKDGQTTITANIPFNSKKITGLANGSARTDSIALGQVQDNTFGTLGTLGGSADTYTASPSPAITAYATGMEFNLKVNATNTGASTLNVSAVGAKNIKKYDGAGSKVDLEAGDLQQDQYYKVIYDGTDFVLDNPSSPIANNLTINKKLNTQPNTATISSGAITYTGAYMVVDTEASASSDDLETINGGQDGDLLLITLNNSSRNVVIKHNVGNIFISEQEDVLLDLQTDSVLLRYDGTNANAWYIVSRSTNKDFLNSKSTNGYTYLPNGLIFQWGNYTGGAHNPTITLPVTFTTSILNVGGIPETNLSRMLVVTGTSLSTISFAQFNDGGGTSTIPFYWTAIGY